MRQQEKSPCRPELPRDRMPTETDFPTTCLLTPDPVNPEEFPETRPFRHGRVASSDPAHRQPQQEDASAPIGVNPCP